MISRMPSHEKEEKAKTTPIGRPTRQLLHKVGNLAISIVVGMATIATTIGAVSVTTAAQSEAASVTTSTPTPSWSIEQSYPAAIENIGSVSCVSSSFCMATAADSSNAGEIISYNGSTWKKVSMPLSAISGLVSCVSVSFCMVGNDIYNGSTWKETNLPSGANSSILYGISCVSPSFCMMVGQSSSGSYIALIYNGSTWKEETLPGDIGDIYSVSCVSTSFCVAIGQGGPTDNAALMYNGATWKEEPLPSNISVYGYTINSVSCVSTSFCLAVGGFPSSIESVGGMALYYNGSTWTIEYPPSSTGGLNGVSCVSTTFCMAIGENTTGFSAGVLYNGSTWSIQSSPNFAGISSFYSISCTSTSFCMAGGPSSVGGGALSYNGSTWQQEPFPYGIAIWGVSCVSTSFCVAVGQNSSGHAMALIYNGSTWKQDTLPYIIGSLGLNGDGNPTNGGISCVSTTFCMAVTQNFSLASIGAIALIYNGSTWKEETVPYVDGNLYSVSCASPSFCMAVGGVSGQVVVFYNGSTWKQENLGVVADTNSVSCVSTTFCMASNVGTGGVYIYNGSSWKQDTSAPSGVGGSVLCLSTSFCMVGGYVYNGSTWKQVNLPNPYMDNLGPLSCVSSNFCEAGGWIYLTNAADTAFTGSEAAAFYYQAGTWTQDSLPPAMNGNAGNSGATGYFINTISCASTSFCISTGAIPGQTVILTTSTVATISSVTPSSSPTTGGGTVTISGTHFGSGTTVSFGQYTLSGSAVTVNSSSSITVRVPPVSSPGMVEISVTTPIGTSNDTGFVYVDTNLSYIPVTPFRIADTRCSTDPPPSFCASENLPQANKNLSSPLAGHSITIQVTGTGIGSDEITSGAQSVVATITAIANNNANNGYLSVYPAGTAPPTASSLNYTAAMTIPNLITATLGKGGAIDIFSSSSNVNITVDIEGYYVPSGSDTQTPANRFTPLPSPIRVLDTRCSTTPKPSYCAAENIPAVNQISAASPDGYIKLKVAGISSIPISATAISLVVTAAGSLSGGYLSVYPTLSSAAPPDTSNVNFHKAVASADSAIVEVGQSGYISIYNSANTPTNVIVDINGYFYSSGDGFSPSSPIRICDTRSQTTIGGKDVVSGLTGQCNNSGVPLDPSLSALLLDPITVQVTGIAGITSTAKVVVANITVVNTGGAGYLTAFPAGTTMPPTSNINWGKGQIMPNMVTAALSPKGQMEIYCSSSCDVVVDVVGWYS